MINKGQDIIDVSIVVPCYNEAASVSTLAKRIFESFNADSISVEIIFVEDGSTDDSLEVLTELSFNNSSIQVIKNEKNMGILQSWRIGALSARSHNICLIDADLQNPPEDLLKLYRVKNATNCSFVQAARSSIERSNDIRWIYSRGLNMLLNLLFKDDSLDNKSGMLIADSTLLLDSLNHLSKLPLCFPNTFIRQSLKWHGGIGYEVESLFLPRRAGESFLAGWKGLAAALKVFFLDLPRAFVEFRLKKFSQDLTLLPLEFRDVVPSIQGEISNLVFWRRTLRELYFQTMPVHKWLIRKDARRFYFELQRMQYFSREQIDEIQLIRLSKLLKHANLTVPYYRKRFHQAKFNPSKMSSLEGLKSIPTLSKDDVRRNLYFDLFSSRHNKRRMLKISTSGSTGEPFVIYADKFQLEVRFATTLRALEWTGWRFGDKQLRLWHQKIGMSNKQYIQEKIDAWFMRRKFIPAFEVSPETLTNFVRTIERTSPILIDGYAESLNFLAEYLKAHKNAELQPKAVMSSAQILPQQTRSLIEHTLNTRVYDKYGSREFSGIAYECRESPGNHHVMDESYIVEILIDGREASPGEVGEVVITDLNNYSTPLIRYRIGDLAMAVEQRKCSCGRSLKLIGAIQGRTQAIVVCADGTWIPGTFFAHFFKDYDHIIRHFQIVQNAQGSFLFNYVPGEQFNETDFETMLINLRQTIGNETVISMKQVDSIPLISTGKRSPVVSNLKIDFQKI